MKIGLLMVIGAGIGRTMAAQTPTVVLQTPVTTARLQAVSVASPKVIWASGTHGTYVVSTDGGATWRAAVVPGADSLEFRDVHAFDARRAVLLASGTGDKSRIYHTADGGAHWNLVFTNTDPKGFYDCFDFRDIIGVVVGDGVDGKFPLRRTEDGGKTWKPYAPPGYQKIIAQEGEGAFAASGTCLAMSPDGAVWVGTAKAGRAIRFGAMGSTAFETPMVKNAPGAGISTIAFRTPREGIAAGGDLARSTEFMDNVIVTHDGGRNWVVAGRPTFTGSMYGLAWVPKQPATVVGVGPKGASWSADGGKTWKPLDSNDYWGIAFGSDGTGWLSGPEGRIARVTFR